MVKNIVDKKKAVGKSKIGGIQGNLKVAYVCYKLDTNMKKMFNKAK